MSPKDQPTLLAIPAQARALAANGAVPTGNWTLAQACDHLARAIEGSLGTLPNNGNVKKRPSWPTRAVGHFLLFRLGYIPRGVPSPQHVLPPADVTFDAAIARLQSAATAFEERATHPHALCRPHPIFGFADFPKWRHFHHVHARHHLRFIKTR